MDFSPGERQRASESKRNKIFAKKKHSDRKSERGETERRHFAVSVVIYIICFVWFESKIFVIKLNLLMPFLPYAKCFLLYVSSEFSRFFFYSFIVVVIVVLGSRHISVLLLSVLFDVCYASSFKIRKSSQSSRISQPEDFWFQILFFLLLSLVLYVTCLVYTCILCLCFRS